MIEADLYTDCVKTYFAFLVAEFGYKFDSEIIRGNVFYNITYKHETKVISVSYENIENYLLVIVFLLDDGALPHYDDATKTLHLNTLIKATFPNIAKSEIESSNELFALFTPNSEIEKKLLKSAKELRLCLTHLDNKL